MEAKYKNLSIFEFQQQFPDNDSCYVYLEKKKWDNGFCCVKCSYTKWCNGLKNRKFDRQCNRCHHVESVTAGTLFHKVKFSILKAFYIIYYVSTNKKGISSTELSRKLALRQQTCWLFKQKVMRAMQSSGDNLLTGQVEVDETVVGQQEEGIVGRKNNKKKLVVIGIEKKGFGVSRMYGKVILNASAKELGGFMKQTISKEATIKTDAWCGYSPLKEHFKDLIQEKSEKKGANFPEMHRVIMCFKSWLRGTHHHVERLQAYVDEYCYRFNKSFMRGNIFNNLISKMVDSDPFPYKLMH